MSRFEGPRGLIGYARIETAEQQTVEVQQSSAVMAGTINGPVKGPFVWLRVERSEIGSFAHLTVDDAREVRDALSAWLADFGGEQADREPSDADLTQDELAALEWCVSHVIEKSRFSQLRVDGRVVTFTDLREKIRALLVAQ